MKSFCLILVIGTTLLSNCQGENTPSVSEFSENKKVGELFKEWKVNGISCDRMFSSKQDAIEYISKFGKFNFRAISHIEAVESGTRTVFLDNEKYRISLTYSSSDMMYSVDSIIVKQVDEELFKKSFIGKKISLIEGDFGKPNIDAYEDFSIYSYFGTRHQELVFFVKRNVVVRYGISHQR